MNQRGGAPPIFVRTITVENLRHDVRRYRLRQQAVVIGERRDVGRIKDVQEGMAIARWLRESSVEAAAPRARDYRPHSVENSRVFLILVESVVKEAAQKSAAL